MNQTRAHKVNSLLAIYAYTLWKYKAVNPACRQIMEIYYAKISKI